MGSYSGRPKEEGGHKDWHLTFNKVTTEACEKVRRRGGNVSKFIEDRLKSEIENLDPGEISVYVWAYEIFLSEKMVEALQEDKPGKVKAIASIMVALKDFRSLCGIPPPDFKLCQNDRETEYVKRLDRTLPKQPIIVTFLMVAIISFFGFVTLQKLGNVALQRMSNQTGLEAGRIMVQVNPYLILAPAVVFAFALLLKAKRSIQSKLKLLRF